MLVLKFIAYIHRWLIVSFSLLYSTYVSAETSEQWQFSTTPVLCNASVKASLNDNDNGGEQSVNPDYHFLRWIIWTTIYHCNLKRSAAVFLY